MHALVSKPEVLLLSYHIPFKLYYFQTPELMYENTQGVSLCTDTLVHMYKNKLTYVPYKCMYVCVRFANMCNAYLRGSKQ
jgi:hypothetical protein